MAWLGIWFSVSNNCDSVWLNGVGQNRESDEEHDEDCIKEGFQLARVKYDRDSEGGREALGLRNCSVNIWDGSELELTWSKKSSSFFENNFAIFLLSGISKSSICKVCDVLHNFLLTKTFFLLEILSCSPRDGDRDGEDPW